MRKICVVTGNRSEYNKLKTIMLSIKEHKDLDLILVVIASHLLDDFGKTINFIKDDGFEVNATARTVAAGEDLISMAKSIGLGALELPTLFNFYKPDILLIVGDRFDVLSAAITAAMMNIPIAHIQGGEVTGTIDESTRHAITKFSHIHFPASEKSAERIIKMGENPKSVFNVGCPSTDIILSMNYKPVKEVCDKFNSQYITAGHKLDPKKPYLMLIQHPVTTEYENTREQIRVTLEAISELGIQTFMLYPNVDAGSKEITREIRVFENRNSIPKVIKLKHVDIETFFQLLNHATCVVGNSSSGIRETCYFGVPTINIGTRQNGRERGKNVVDVGHDKQEIKEAILKQIEHGPYDIECVYGKGGKVGKKIADVLATINIKNVQKKLRY